MPAGGLHRHRRPNEIFCSRVRFYGMDVHVPNDWNDVMDFTSLTLQQVRDYHKLPVPHLPMEQFTKSMCPEIKQTIVVIPNWDDKGNQQMYVKQVDGTWIDCYNECYVTNEFVMARIKEREMENV